MRESEEYLESNKYWSDESSFVKEVILLEDAEHAVKLAYKEGYLEAKADILQLLRQEEGLLMISAIVAIREMKIDL